MKIKILLRTLVKTYLRFFYIVVFCLILLTVSCDKEVSRSPVEPEAPQGFIFINSLPDGFTIYQDGRNTGRITPDSISYIEAGTYQITLKKKYFKDTSLVVNLNSNEKLNLNVDFISNPSIYGGLYLQTLPMGASITINDSALNKVTPLSLQNLLPGEYRINFKLLNYRDSDITAIVQSNKTNNYSAELRDTSEWVDYQVFNSGIQSNSLSAIAVDNNNVKWIGSLDQGLIKYDEVNFINYSTSNSSIPSNAVKCISIDQQNRVWVGTDAGIGVFNGITWIIYNKDNSGLSVNFINSIRFDDIGNTWIGTSANLAKFDGINWILFNNPLGLGTDYIEDFYLEDQNKIWLGTRTFGIFILQNGIFNEISKIQYNYPTYAVSSISLDQSNYLWFCFLPDSSGRSGISYWDGNSFTNFWIGTPQNNINNIFVDEQNNKWFATTEGVTLFDAQNSSSEFNASNSFLTANNVRSSVRDQNGNVWITTIGGGLNKYKPPQ